MSVRGSLKKGQLGFSMPAYAPLFPKPPYFYKNATLMGISNMSPYERVGGTDDSEDTAVELSDPPTAGLVFASYPSSNLGPYGDSEVVLLR